MQVEQSRIKFVRGGSIPLVPASHEDPHKPGVLKRVLGSRSDFPVGQVQMVNWAVMPAHRAFREHYHEDMIEVFVIVGGMCRMESTASNNLPLDQEDLGPGDCAIVPAGVRHRMKSLGETDTVYVVMGVSTMAGGKTVVTE